MEERTAELRAAMPLVTDLREEALSGQTDAAATTAAWDRAALDRPNGAPHHG